jgi:hypothetical protein
MSQCAEQSQFEPEHITQNTGDGVCETKPIWTRTQNTEDRI